MNHLQHKDELTRVEWTVLLLGGTYILGRRAVMYGAFAGYAYLYHRWSGIAERTGQTYSDVANAEVEVFAEGLANWLVAHGEAGLWAATALVFVALIAYLIHRWEQLETTIIAFWEANWRTRVAMLGLLAIGIYIQLNKAQIEARLVEVWPL